MQKSQWLVLSGGGVKGAYQAGAVRYLMTRGYKYDGFCGVSVGALNSALLAQFDVGKEAVDALTAIWEGLTTPDIYKSWFPFGRLSALWKPSLYDSSPLRKLVETHLDPAKVLATGKKLRIGAVSLSSGAYRVFDESFAGLQDAVLASSAFPGMLTPVSIDGELWLDGGVKIISPIKAAIDAGATHIDVVLTSPSTSSQASITSSSNVITIGERTIDLMSDEICAKDVREAQYVNQLVAAGLAPGKRNIAMRIYRPESVLTNDSLNFDPALIKGMISAGFHDAIVTNALPGV